MTTTCKVQIIRDGDQQSIIIPPEISLSTTVFTLRQEDGKLILEPIQKPSLLEVLATLEDLDENFPDIDGGGDRLTSCIFPINKLPKTLNSNKKNPSR